MSDSLKTAYLQPTAAKGVVNLNAPDLTIHPPRSPRVRLGGFVHLPRLIDKGRAVLAGKAGDFHYNCPIDQGFFAFTGIDHEAFYAEIKSGKNDTELLEYVRSHLSPARNPSEIVGWSRWYEDRVPSRTDQREFFNEIHGKNAPNRDDIGSWFDWLDLDDFVTYGGKV